MNDLPPLIPEDLNPTRDYLREAALVLGSLQRAFLPKHPRDWQHGLEIGMRGLLTQEFVLNDVAQRGSLDLVRRKLRVGDSHWSLKEYGGPELLSNVKIWLVAQGVAPKLDEPKLGQAHVFDAKQSDVYAQALWWMDKQFRVIKAGLKTGTSSPVLLYPHHFDLSLSWFPHDDERQISLGWSTGDETIAESYLYLTVYPEPASFKRLRLPAPAYWQSDGFSGAILLYKDVANSSEPVKLLASYAAAMQATAPLLG